MAISVTAHIGQHQPGARVQPGVPGLQPAAAPSGACGMPLDHSASYGCFQLPTPPVFPMGPLFGFPFLPGMVPPMDNGKGGCMLPTPPMMFPHPAQLQAMGAAAQAAMAQAAQQPGGMPACFPMPMFPSLPMMQQQGSAGAMCMQQQHQLQQPSQTCSQSPTPAAEPGATAADAADEDDCAPDGDVEVEPELEQIFEKVAAMERAHKAAMVAVQQRACSPSGSLHSASTGLGNRSSCSSPSAAAAAPLGRPPAMFCQQRVSPPAPQTCAAAPSGELDAAPVPWLAFAADDKGDDLDADLAQLITLPGEAPQHNSSKASSKPNSPTGAAAGKPQLLRLKRVSSTSSAYSSGEALAGPAAASLVRSSSSPIAGSSGGTGAQQQPKVLRIRSIKGATGRAGKAATGSKIGSAGKAPAVPSCKSSSSSSKPGSGQQKAAPAGLGPVKAAVQKKAADSSSKAKPHAAVAPANKQRQQQAAGRVEPQQKAALAASPAAAPAAVRAPAPCTLKVAAASASPPVAAAAAAADDDLTLGLLGELDSGLSDTCLGSGADDMAIDSFAYLDGLLLQESSDDAWEGLLGGPASTEEMELCSSLVGH